MAMSLWPHFWPTLVNLHRDDYKPSPVVDFYLTPRFH